ncbi:hypothetical protein, partial [Streptomyces sp. SBT349]|uniref:hypothetical protein n=1 Tax=Streptomyces sp. SBT349 TaxID=1580539 RepID=UPI00066EA567
MTDTGQMPEGTPQPAQAGVPAEQPAQPGVPGPAVFPFPGPPDEAGDGEDEDLLMPGANGAWGEAVVAPRPAVPRAPASEPSTQRLAAVAPPGPTPTEPEYLDIAAAAQQEAANQTPAPA